MENFSDLFQNLVRSYVKMSIKYPHLKAVTIAQWTLESAYGHSKLSTEHFNFGGLKWRREMQGYATKIRYETNEGPDDFCKFVSLEAFIKGYWKFMSRLPYRGWETHAMSEEDYISFISPIYCPGDIAYSEKVLNLLPGARRLLTVIEAELEDAEVVVFDGYIEPGTSEPIDKPIIKQFIPSPNYSSRNSVPIRRIILHYTTSSNVNGTIDWFQRSTSKVSAHYIVDKNGDIYQMVNDSDKAWHAKYENSDSIGIEHVAQQGERLTEEQELSTVHLIRWLMVEYKVPKEEITGHRFTPYNRNRTDCPHSLFGEQTEDALRNWVNQHLL